MLTKAEIQLYRSLGDKRERDTHGLFVAEGAKLVGEIVASPLRIVRLLTTSDFPNAEVISTKEMERISQLKTPTDTFAVVEKPLYNIGEANPENNLVLALDGVQNPGNVGTIIRLADWFGISDIVCSADSADCFNPKVVQATMGAILRVRVHYTNLADYFKKLPVGTPIYGTFLEGENLYSAKVENRGIIVMGSEGRGVSAEVAKTITNKLFIPPYPADNHNSESLNVAIATAIICAEFRRAK
ncbi:MAG: RNA methyltransferase [Rikenellaceae bacterium]|nr:RNA methyltransferase [Rikenellaceae bacterium]